MILCCGEALIDMLPSVDRQDRDGFVPYVGGSVFNTAVALGRLGINPGFLSGLSTDIFGKMIQEALAESGVDFGLSICSDAPTTLAFVELNDGHAKYHFYDENTAGRMLTKDMIPAIPTEVSTVYFGGISLIVEPCGDFYLALAQQAAQGKVVMADPNIRPSFIKDVESYRTRLNALLAVCDILKVSDEDLDWIMPGPQSPLEKAHALAKDGPAIIILTRGKEGARAIYGGGKTLDVDAFSATVVDTVGAGDTFNAGVLAGLSAAGVLTKQAISSVSEEALRDAMTLGARVASITVSRAGANPPWAHELNTSSSS